MRDPTKVTELRGKGRQQIATQIIITDLGRVLVDFRPPEDHEDFYSRCSVTREEIRRFFKESEELRAFETETGATRKFFEAVRAKLGFRGDLAEFEMVFDNIDFSLKQDVYDLLFLDVKTRYDLEFWLLSNINERHWAYINHNRSWPGISANCRRVFLSYELGCRKPEKEIYLKALKAGGGSPDTCFFIDDTEANVVAARKLGIPSARFENLPKLKADLKEICRIET